MIIFPAIDLRHGNCVRLLYGDPHTQTIYSNNPAQIATQFAETGAEWLHVINLDGALDDPDGTTQNLEAIQSILDQVDIPIQVGGGIRSVTAIEHLLEMGVSRVILGTMAVERPRQLPDIIARFGAEQIVVGIDARDGKVATHGWQSTSEIEAITLGKELHALGVTRTVYTDISRDGALTGINLQASVNLAQQTGLKVIISGGAATLDDVRRTHTAPAGTIEGLILGRALYTGNIDLAEALASAHL